MDNFSFSSLSKRSRQDENVFEHRSNTYMPRENLLKLYNKQKHWDVKLEVEGKEFKAHKIVLASVFQFFDGLFEYNNSNVFKLDPVHFANAKNFETLLEFAYTSKIRFTHDFEKKDRKAEDLCKMALHMGETELLTATQDFLGKTLNSSNIISRLIYAHDNGLEVLTRFCQEYLKNNPSNIHERSEYLDSPVSEIDLIVDAMLTHSSHKAVVFEIIVKWVGHDWKERMKYLANMLARIPMKELPGEFLKKQVSKNPIITRDIETMNMYLEAISQSIDAGFAGRITNSSGAIHNVFIQTENGEKADPQLALQGVGMNDFQRLGNGSR